MKKHAFIFSTSNLFTVYSQSVLRHDFQLHVRNLRYANEGMSADDHFTQQIKELFNNNFYERGLIFTKYDYKYADSLLFRIDMLFEEVIPSLLFFEMKTCKPAEWLLLEYIHEKYKVPMAVYMNPSTATEANLLKLSKNGVKEVVTDLNEESFRNIIIRHTETCS